MRLGFGLLTVMMQKQAHGAVQVCKHVHGAGVAHSVQGYATVNYTGSGLRWINV